MKVSEENLKVSEVGKVMLHVNDLQRSVDWYADLLQIPVPTVSEEANSHLFTMENGVDLQLIHNEGQKQPICMLKADDIETVYDEARQSGVVIVEELHKSERPHFFTVEDSEGNVLMICQPGYENNEGAHGNASLPSNAAHSIANHISSIVVPVTDLKRATEWYSRLLGKPIIPERQDGGPIYWFDMPNGTGILLDDNRNNQDLGTFPTFMLKTDHIRSAFHFVQSKGINIVRDIQFDHYFMIEDIEGNTMMICLS